ncbi:MAG: glycosyltransferase [Sphingopyxis sp.]|nr:glycosyltransferase [Sphingopyxis sp.]
MTAPTRILHLHSSFSLGGKEARATRLMNLMGPRAVHVVLSAVPDALGARDAIAADVDVDLPGDSGAPPLHGKPGLRRYRALARYMQGFDLVLSYNWGAMDGVMARRMLSPFMALPPLVHHEDGFNEDESVKRNWKRSAFRRLALPTAEALVVPSDLLQRIAKEEWSTNAQLICNGIDVAAYHGPPDQPIPGLDRRDGDIIIGTVAGLRAVKDLPALVRAVAPLPPNVRLAIVGEGSERETIVAAADACGMADRLILPGFMAAPHRWIGHFDVLALSSRSEQAPIAVIEAMAAGLPIASPDVGDVAAMVAPENRIYIVPEAADLTHALARLIGDAECRRAVGGANAELAALHFDERTMVASYDAVYGAALGGRSLFTG